MSESNIKIRKTKLVIPALICVSIWALPFLFSSLATSRGITVLQCFIVGLIAFLVGSATVLMSSNPEQSDTDEQR